MVACVVATGSTMAAAGFELEWREYGASALTIQPRRLQLVMRKHYDECYLELQR